MEVGEANLIHYLNRKDAFPYMHHKLMMAGQLVEAKMHLVQSRDSMLITLYVHVFICKERES